MIRYSSLAAKAIKPGMHVVPVDDLVEHDTAIDSECVCGPHRQDVPGGFLVIHNSLDGRERFEDREVTL